MRLYNAYVLNTVHRTSLDRTVEKHARLHTHPQSSSDSFSPRPRVKARFATDRNVARARKSHTADKKGDFELFTRPLCAADLKRRVIPSSRAIKMPRIIPDDESPFRSKITRWLMRRKQRIARGKDRGDLLEGGGNAQKVD